MKVLSSSITGGPNTFTEYSSYLKKKKKLISQSAQMNSDISNLNMNKLFFLN